MNLALKKYIPLVEFIAQIAGKNFEVVLHDISQLESSVIAISNNHHTGRNIGSPITDLALKILKEKEYLNKDFITNYPGQSNGKSFMSSTYFIKEEGELIGLLCINNDTKLVDTIESTMRYVLSMLDFRSPQTKEVRESIQNPLSSLAESIIQKTISASGINPDRMTSKEKMAIVHSLNDQGVLLLKGAVCDIAKQLNISEPTVYRYLNQKP